MKIADTIYSFVCDDVREEVGNKLTFVGVYQKEIILPKFPTLLPKLAIVIFIDDLKKPLPAGYIKAHIPGRKPQEIKFNKSRMSKNKAITMSFFIAPVRFEEVGEAIFEFYLGKEKKPTYTRTLIVREMD